MHLLANINNQENMALALIHGIKWLTTAAFLEWCYSSVEILMKTRRNWLNWHDEHKRTLTVQKCNKSLLNWDLKSALLQPCLEKK